MNVRTRGGAEETRVLVVEDDRGIAESLVRGLRQAGYGVEGVRTGRAALAAPTPDVVLLDLGLPDIDGVEVCRRLRARSDAAIIAVTARGEEADRVVALDEGGDDYLVKPFGLAELLARIRAVLRRRRPAGPEILRHGPLALDLRTRQVFLDGRRVGRQPRGWNPRPDPPHRHGGARHRLRRTDPAAADQPFRGRTAAPQLSLLTLVFLLVHVVTAVLDPFVHLGWTVSVVPFGACYRPLWLGLGTVALDLLLAVLLTSALRRRIGVRRWKAVH
ncbi:response regulator transcription factor [Streptomyces griseorubiginosus]|uniref:response regulator transcription factor n=1 Tax=Streptomyces griseorubiginosus TaxID=67304 RepID=UPI00332DA613